MECPYCKYKNGWVPSPEPDEVGKDHLGEEGEFFLLPIEMKRTNPHNTFATEEASVYACPNCGRVFIET